MPAKKYKHPLSHYPSVYGCNIGSIQRYSLLNYPLDDVEATKLLISQQRTAPTGTHLAANDPVARPKKIGALGLAESIKRLQTAEATAHAEYQAAKTELTAGRKLKEWMALAEQLRKIEKDSPDIQQANSKSISVDDLEQSLSKTFAVLRKELENLPRRLETELVGKDILSIREILTAETDSIIATLYKCEWLGVDSES